jgi:hypothetical protein
MFDRNATEFCFSCLTGLEGESVEKDGLLVSIFLLGIATTYDADQDTASCDKEYVHGNCQIADCNDTFTQTSLSS